MKILRELIETFRAPSAEVLAQRELEEAQRSLLESLSAREYADALCKYNSERVARLSGTALHRPTSTPL